MPRVDDSPSDSGCPVKAEIVKEFTFEAAHHLPEVEPSHKCARVHGHLFRVEVAVEGEVDPVMGWVMDFGELAIAAQQVIAELDHRVLNALPGLANPTSENLAHHLFDRLSARVTGVSSVTVHESPTSRCTWRPARTDAPAITEIVVNIGGLLFSAAHLLVLPPATREPIHGHDYRMTALATMAPGCEGDMEGTLRTCAESIAAELDHKVILAGRPAVGRLELFENSCVLTVGAETVTLPLADCAILDMGNTTTEALAAWLAVRIAACPEIRALHATRVEVSLLESLDASARAVAPVV